jgi:hypothetical protein
MTGDEARVGVFGGKWKARFRLYGPPQPWLDKTWRPGEIQMSDTVDPGDLVVRYRSIAASARDNTVRNRAS